MPQDPEPTARSFADRPALLAFAVAAATVLLQFIQTRVFGVHFWNHYVYFIVSIALLGFGIAGTWLALGRDTLLARKLTIRAAAVLFVVSAVVSTWLAPNWTVSLMAKSSGITRHSQLLLTYGAAVLPYFFGGWILGILFRDNAQQIHGLYFFDLMGAGGACLLWVAVIRPLGAIHLSVVCCLLLAVPCLLHGRRDRRTWIGAGVVAICLAPLLLFEAQVNRSLRFNSTKDVESIRNELGPGTRFDWKYSEWNSLSRVDVFTPPNSNLHWVTIDGAASTSFSPTLATVPPFGPRDHLIISHSPWFFQRNCERVLIIGVGGGIDIWNALRAGSKAIDGVEINPTTYDLGLDRFRDVNGDLFHRPEVTLHNEDGRSFVRRSPNEYDVILLSGVDTFNASAAGAYVLSEAYLYTVEGLADYLRHLSPDGALCIARGKTPDEKLRLFSTAIKALRVVGVQQPERCILVHSAKPHSNAILVKRKPFTESEITRYRGYLKTRGLLLEHPPSPTESKTPWAEQRPFQEFLLAEQQGKLEPFFAAQRSDLRPTWDDSPFFFNFEKFSLFPEVIAGSLKLGHSVYGNWASVTMAGLLLVTVVAVLVFILLPLIYRTRKSAPLNIARGRFARWVLYFSCLGVSFIAIEIALMQRFALLLGHPSRSLVLVLGGLLLSAGAGSFLAGRFPKLFRNAALGAALLALVAAYGYPLLTAQILAFPLELRALCTLLMICPLGILMGMPFPTGIQRVERESNDLVPWMWGVNGGTTVVGSILAILLAMALDFTWILTLGGLGYVVAFATSRSLDQDSAPAVEAPAP